VNRVVKQTGPYEKKFQRQIVGANQSKWEKDSACTNL